MIIIVVLEVIAGLLAFAFWPEVIVIYWFLGVCFNVSVFHEFLVQVMFIKFSSLHERQTSVIWKPLKAHHWSYIKLSYLYPVHAVFLFILDKDHLKCKRYIFSSPHANDLIPFQFYWYQINMVSLELIFLEKKILIFSSLWEKKECNWVKSCLTIYILFKLAMLTSLLRADHVMWNAFHGIFIAPCKYILTNISATCVHFCILTL